MDMITATLQAIKQAHRGKIDLNDPIFKTWTTAGGGTTGSTGLVFYDLEAPAKKLYPVLTPLRNIIPRVRANGGNATNWKAIVDINTDRLNFGIQEGRRAGVMKTLLKDYTAVYKGYGLEDTITFESEYADDGFDDVRARATEGLLRASLIGEEQLILGGMGSVGFALGTTPTPTLTAGTAGTSAPGMAASAVFVRCMALTHEGFWVATVANGCRGEVVRTDADTPLGVTPSAGNQTTYGGGSAQASASATTTPAANTSIIATCTPVRGAVAYAWYWGSDNTTNCFLGAITGTSFYEIKTNAGTGTQPINVASQKFLTQDNSINHYVFDGILAFIADPNGGSYYKALAAGNTGLTADTTGGVVELDDAFRSFWDNYKLSPDTIWCNAQEVVNIAKKILGFGGSALVRFNYDIGSNNTVAGHTLTGGSTIGSYLNKFTMAGGEIVPIKIHPNLAPGTILFTSTSIPYPLSNVSNVLQMKMRRDWYQIEWPLRTRMYEFGVYADGLMQNYFPPAFGKITNIANA